MILRKMVKKCHFYGSLKNTCSYSLNFFIYIIFIEQITKEFNHSPDDNQGNVWIYKISVGYTLEMIPGRCISKRFDS
jgi:hypothetical protein